MDGTEIRFNYLRPFEGKPAKVEDSVEVQRLPASAMIPEKKVAAMSTGKIEEFVVNCGFLAPDLAPQVPTVAAWVSMKGRSIAHHEFVYAGPTLEVYFMMEKWLGRDGRDQGSPETLISLTQPASGLKFKRNSSVSEWAPIQEM